MSAEKSKNASNLVTLLSRDGIVIPISSEAVKQSTVVRRLFEDASPSTDKVEVQIPVPNIDGAELKKVVGFLEYHVDDFIDSTDWQARLTSNQIEPFDKTLVEVEQEEVLKILYAANFLDVPQLMDLCSKNIAIRLKGKNPEEIREFFQIRNDLSREEEEVIRLQNGWCF